MKAEAASRILLNQQELSLRIQTGSGYIDIISKLFHRDSFKIQLQISRELQTKKLQNISGHTVSTDLI